MFASSSMSSAQAEKDHSLCLPIGFGFKVRIGSRYAIISLTAFSLYLAAALIGNEWLYLLGAAFLIAPVLGFIYPLLMLSQIGVEVSVPKEVLVNEMAVVMLKLTRKALKGRWARLFPVRCFFVGVSLRKKFYERDPGAPLISAESVAIDVLAEQSWLEFPTAAMKRGVYTLQAVTFTSSFPFGIFTLIRTERIKREVGTMTVYPKVLTLSGNFLEHLEGLPTLSGIATCNSVIRHNSTFYRAVREFKTGDSLRHIHWASTARTGKILVKEFEQETQPVFDLLLNLRANWRHQDQFELAVCTLGSLCHFAFQIGHVPALRLNPSLNSAFLQELMSDLPSDQSEVDRCLEILARVEPVTTGGDQKMDTGENEFARGEDEAQVLAILPGGEQVLMYFPDRGDVVSWPVEITLLSSRSAQALEPGLASWGGVGHKRGVSVADLSQNQKNIPQWQLSLGDTKAQTIARVEWEGDLEAL